MRRMNLLIVLAFVTGVVRGRDECRSLRGGVIVAWGCRSYTLCRHGIATQVDCHSSNLVYNPIRKACDNKLNTPAPCGLYRDCQKQDGRYADLFTNCTAFYTCQLGKFYGHNQCNPGLVFNEPAQVCDWPASVLPPCGSLGGAPKGAPAPTRHASPRMRPTQRPNRKRGSAVTGEYGARDVRPRRFENRDIRARTFEKSDVRGRRFENSDVRSRKVAKGDARVKVMSNDIRSRRVMNKKQHRGRKQDSGKAVPLVSRMTYKEFVHGF